MRRRWSVSVTLVLAATLVPAWTWRGRAEAKAKPDAEADPAASVKRGDYLVNQVARCGDCHTPRDARGRLDNSRLLQGAPVWFTPNVRRGKWERRAPDITASGKAGKWSQAKMTTFFSTGKKADAPMPAYKLSMDDARAVTAYLRSLPGRKKQGRRGKTDDD
jgi:mono/diheme cytochrome c family protein